jgi:hypothetical protein
MTSDAGTAREVNVLPVPWNSQVNRCPAISLHLRCFFYGMIEPALSILMVIYTSFVVEMHGSGTTRGGRQPSYPGMADSTSATLQGNCHIRFPENTSDSREIPGRGTLNSMAFHLFLK